MITWDLEEFRKFWLSKRWNWLRAIAASSLVVERPVPRNYTNYGDLK